MKQAPHQGSSPSHTMQARVARVPMLVYSVQASTRLLLIVNHHARIIAVTVVVVVVVAVVFLLARTPS